MDSLSEAVHANMFSFRDISINYTEWLLNQNTGITAGQPNKQFFESAKQVIDYASQNGIKLQLTWGAHITISRFLGEKSLEDIMELLKYFKTSETLGKSKPEIIDVGDFMFSRIGFEFKVSEHFKLY